MTLFVRGRLLGDEVTANSCYISSGDQTRVRFARNIKLQSETVIFNAPLALGSCGANFLLTTIALFAALFTLDFALRRTKTRAWLRYLLVGLGLGLVLMLLAPGVYLQPEIVQLTVAGAEVKIGSCSGLSHSKIEYARADLRFGYAIAHLGGQETPVKYLLRIRLADGRDLGQLDLSNPRVDLDALRQIAPDVVEQFAASR